MYSKIQYISQGATSEDQVDAISSVLDGGCTWIQLRFKNTSAANFLQTALKVKALCEQYNATLIINDNVELAKEIDACGVHLGLTDTSIENARKILGETKIIGGTANTLEHVLQRIYEKCNYIGLGPFRFTSTKEKLSPILGIEGYQYVMNSLKSKGIEIPIFAIGGIKVEDVNAILNTGIYGVSLSGTLTHIKNPTEIITQLNKNIYASA
jgi:thiamine-phosphate pyrophosphorylase